MTFDERRCGCHTFLTLTDTGAYHLRHGLPNQDRVGFGASGGSMFLAVSDGVGSCACAGRGAAYAVRACREVFGLICAGTLKPDGEPIAQKLVSLWLGRVDGDPNRFCATLKAVFAHDGRAVLVSLGDGAAAAVSGDRAISVSEDDDCFANETKCFGLRVRVDDFVTGALEVGEDRPFAAFCCTDGISGGLLPGGELGIARTADIADSCAGLCDDLQSLISVISEYIDDDKTIGVVKYDPRGGRADRARHKR